MKWDEMINYIKSEKIRTETENSKTVTSNKTPNWYRGEQLNSGNKTDTIRTNYKIICLK